MSYQKPPHEHYPPPGYAPNYPSPGYPPSAPPPPALPYEGYPPPSPPSGYPGYPPPPGPRQPYEGYQGYFVEGYPPPPPPPGHPQYQHYHYEHHHYQDNSDGCSSFLKGCSLISLDMATTKNIVAQLNKDLKLNNDNYDIWSMKIQYVLEELEVLETLMHVMEKPKEGHTAQHKRDSEAFIAWKQKNNLARITLLSAMTDDTVRPFKNLEFAKDIWDAVKEKYGGISMTKLRELTIKFDTYKKLPNNTMKQHLRVMANMVSELREAGHQLTDEQQVQAIIRSSSHL
ncbi:uncharacterized protein LOC131179976 [Hevea brasiliensis]|uniref:uncharacterized protein LOC131179976 n=1 Tax=Hevea brasiliensis TaxID=3981 RepID=UPI0025F65E5A|nr:uncharacterized protein LOC131179976 [Hevea brasiliensis]XP_058003408.1 uncharacterized protein LOC131179976 [Hevea brasiliensis]